MDKAAQQGNPSTYHLPKPKVEGSPYDFSFSGLKTAVINTIHNANQKGETIQKNDMAAAFQQTVCAVSYTHLDVYKRQACSSPPISRRKRSLSSFSWVCTCLLYTS